MNRDFFSSLLLCEVCAHGVDYHDAEGCGSGACDCSHTRTKVIETSLHMARMEQYEALRVDTRKTTRS